MFQNYGNNEPITGGDRVHKDVWHLLKFISTFFGWIVLPFIPLYLVLPYPDIFNLLLLGYVIFFVILNRFIMHYPWVETFVFLFFFLFCVLLVKTLFDYQVFDEKEVVKKAVFYGTFE